MRGLLGLLFLLGQIPAGYTISGTVVQNLTRQPVKNVHVTIMRDQHLDQQLTVVTKEDGRFFFTDLPQSKYTLSAEYHGVTQGYQQHEEFSTGIAVGAGLDSEHIVFRLISPAVLAVSVTDEENEPVRNAQIILFHKRVTAGWQRIGASQQANTDSGGVHRFGHLLPGTYFVAVEAQPWYAQHPFPGQAQPAATDQQREMLSQLDVAYPITYYSSAVDAASATPLTLTEGSTTEIAISLHALRASHVTLPAGMAPQLSAIGPGGVLFFVNGVGFGGGDEHTEITGIAPGRYVVSASSNGEQPGFLGSAQIDVGGNTTLDLTHLAKTSIGGTVSFEGTQKPANAGVLFGNVRSGDSLYAEVKPDGSFQVNSTLNFPAGQYEVRLTNTPGFGIKSIAAKGMDYADGLLDVKEGQSAQISIIAMPGETSVKGVALRDGKAFSGALVLLVPQDRSRGRFMPRDQSDSDGTFSLNNAHPGRYKLIAIDDGMDLAYQEPGVLKPYLDGGRTVDVPLPEGTMVSVNVQRRVI